MMSTTRPTGIADLAAAYPVDRAVATQGAETHLHVDRSSLLRVNRCTEYPNGYLMPHGKSSARSDAALHQAKGYSTCNGFAVGLQDNCGVGPGQVARPLPSLLHAVVAMTQSARMG